MSADTRPVQLFAAAIVLPSEPTDRLEALRAKHGFPPWVPAIPLHITLVPPFMTHESADDLASRWEPVALHREPFDVTIAGFGRFDAGRSVVFAAVERTEALTALAFDALSALSDLRIKRGHPFTPHVTLAASAPRGTIDAYIARLYGEELRLTFPCDRFSMLRLDSDTRRWDVVREFGFS